MLRRRVVRLTVLSVLLIYLFPSQANADLFRIDSFNIIRNGVLFFQDQFDNGVPPPNAPNFSTGLATNYLVNGSFGPESAGKLTINTANGEVSPNISESGFSSLLRATLATSTTGGASALSNTSTLFVSSIFDLVLPSQNGTLYGVQLSDASPTVEGNDIIRIAVVKRASDGQFAIEFRDLDDPANSNILLAQALLDPNHQQIVLILRKDSASSNVITGSYAYLDNGFLSGQTDFTTTTTAFNGENFTRAQFLTRAPLQTPEPSTLLLTLLGFGLVACTSRRLSVR